jgi:hypothetical protein
VNEPISRMPLPAPPVALVDACSTIFNNTLYTYSASAFQSLPLVQGAEWLQLSMGQPVSGGVCVQATPTDDKSPAALYIVGGKANATGDDYQGLQRYIFSERRWEALNLSTAVTQNRLNHNAVYLNASASILMYAGSQDGTTGLSSQTFTISTIAPYTVLAYESIAPPAISPLLMQWSESKAVMIGGSETNKQVMLFSPSTAWVDSNITLANSLKDPNAVKAVVLNGDDGSKNLFTFDVSVSPNQVNRTVLIDANGNPVSNAQPITSRSLAEELHSDGLEKSVANNVKRGNLTLATWPAYNDTLAPTSTRDGFSIAKDESGLVVICGGNTDDVLCIFNARDNSWTNATALLEKSSVQSAAPSTIVGTSTASSSAQTPSQSAAAVGTDASSTTSTPTPKLIGAIIGSILCLVVVISGLLLLLRWRRNRRRFTEAGHQRRASGIPSLEKDPMDFADRGLNFGNHSNGYHHGQQESQGSFSSMAILMGNVGQNQKRGVLGRRNGSNGSDSSSTFNKKYKTAISKPIPQSNFGPSGSFTVAAKGASLGRGALAPAPAPSSTARPRGSGTARRGSTRRSSGWNRYWSGGSALNILGFGSKRATDYDSGSDRASGSQYSDAGLPSTTTQVSQVSAIPPPLNLGRPAGRMSRVASNSPTIGHASDGFPLKEGMAGQIERPGSSSTVSSYNDHRDTISTGVPASVHQDTWTPVSGSGWGRGGEVPNITYSESKYTTILPRGRPTDSSSHAAPSDRRDQPQHSSDMSWLNLGAGER